MDCFFANARRFRVELSVQVGVKLASRSVAQPGSASGLGPEGREFESLHSDQNPNVIGGIDLQQIQCMSLFETAYSPFVGLAYLKQRVIIMHTVRKRGLTYTAKVNHSGKRCDKYFTSFKSAKW